MRIKENKPAEPERKITMGSLFDGIGGFPLAAVRNGIEPVWASEIEAFPIAVTRLRFPQMQHVGDITQLEKALRIQAGLEPRHKKQTTYHEPHACGNEKSPSWRVLN